MSCDFSKQSEESAIRVAWDGNIGLKGCDNCCMRWFLTFDGEECIDPGPIDVALHQDLSDINQASWFDEYRPASIVGFCRGTNSSSLSTGSHTVSLSVGACAGLDLSTSQVLTGYNSVSRFIIEEFPDEDQKCGEGKLLP